MYTAEVKRRDKSGIARMNYHDFLTATMKLAVKVFPESKSVDEAFQRILVNNVLPKAWRRNPEPVDAILDDPDVQTLYQRFADALEQIFQFYASCTIGDEEGRTIQRASPKSPGGASGTLRSTGSTALSTRGKMGGTNSMKSALGYSEFLKFASDFDLSNSVILSTRELGDIYLSCLRMAKPGAHLAKLDFVGFWEALVRCAMRAYSKISHSTPVDRVRGLFLYMWRSITRSVPRAFDERKSVTTYAGDLLAGAMLFNKRFTAMWADDDYRDYLVPVAMKEESGKDVLSRLLTGDLSATLQAALTRPVEDAPPTPLQAEKSYAQGSPSPGYGVRPAAGGAAASAHAAGGYPSFQPSSDADAPPPPPGVPPAEAMSGSGVAARPGPGAAQHSRRASDFYRAAR